MEKSKNSYYLGLDIGTDSVGYAVTDESYDLKKFHGEPAWGVTLFDAAQLCAERRGFRTGRRRLDRRQQRVRLIRELFAKEIAKTDEVFFRRMDASALLEEDCGFTATLFDDDNYTDADYHREYPTIHHLIADLMHSDRPHDVRLVYLACAWLVAHRGHFLSDVSLNNVAGLTDFSVVWSRFTDYLAREEGELPWQNVDVVAVSEVLRRRSGVNARYKELSALLFAGAKPPKESENFRLNCECLLKLICGGKVQANALFNTESYEDISSFSLGDSDEALDALYAQLGDDAEPVRLMKGIYDWALLVDILNGQDAISDAKVKVYEQHAQDLKTLKYILHKYASKAQFASVFRDMGKDNYAAYTGHVKLSQKKDLKRKGKADVSKFILKALDGIKPEAEDEALFADMTERLHDNRFLPKQRDTDNRVIPYQLYWHELNTLLKNAEHYLPFLAEKDESGLSVSEKILSVFTFRVPYYVGPLVNRENKHAWIVRKAEGRILPWNFDELVDKDRCEEEFIRRMTNRCTYIPYADVLPKESLLYHRFTVLNEINNLKVDGEGISVAAKQQIFTGLYEQRRKVTRKALENFMLSNGIMTKGQTVSGVDEALHSDLRSWHDFRRLLTAGLLTEEQAEQIIEHITVTEDRSRLKLYLSRQYPQLDEKDIHYLSSLGYKDFGRLSGELLTGITVDGPDGSDSMTVMRAMWETNCNLMELLSENYDFAGKIQDIQKEYYASHATSLAERLDEMYVSNAVKRPVLRALEITKEVTKAFGGAPEKIFVEMARGATEDQKNKRTKTRLQQLNELYSKCKCEDVPALQEQLSAMGDTADTRLQSDRLFLYYMQLGRCMYTGQPMEISLIAGDTYNIEHIYPRKQVKDDSIINNEVLVLSSVNGEKSDRYPIDASIRAKMTPFWNMLRSNGLLSDEKYHRLTRTTGFTEEEKMGFIQCQLTETTQSTKAVAEILKERYPDTHIVYVKARLASELRQFTGCLKSRLYNDLHHAKDAYLNIVAGNVYDMKFSRRWFNINSEYSVKTEVLFTQKLVLGGKLIWKAKMLDKVKKYMGKNNAHMTKYAYCKQGGYFDQMPVKAAPGLIPRKSGMPTEKYGGYNKAAISFFVPVHYKAGKKEDTIILPVDLLNKDRFLRGGEEAVAYAAQRIEQITGKQATDITFPMGTRVWKVNTMLSLDGFKVTITGSASGGRCIIPTPFMPFSGNIADDFYLKKLEMLVEKYKKYPSYQYNAENDKVTAEENVRLYELYVQKLSNTVYMHRPNNPLETLKKGKEKFIALPMAEQVKALLNIHAVFCRVSSGCDLSAVGGTARAAATVSFSNTVSNWKKNYKDVRLIDMSASGLWEKQSENLLELL